MTNDQKLICPPGASGWINGIGWVETYGRGHRGTETYTYAYAMNPQPDAKLAVADSGPTRAQRLEWRLTELRSLMENDVSDSYFNKVQAIIFKIFEETGKAPGLFLDEDEMLEARWVFPVTDNVGRHVVSVTFTNDFCEIYIFDRGTDQITSEATFCIDSIYLVSSVAKILSDIEEA